MRAVIAVALGAVLAGCGGPNLSVSVRAGSPAATAAARGALTAGSGIVLTRVRIVIRKVELEKAGTSEMEEIASGPYLLDLSGAALDSGSVAQLVDATFTPGTYSEIKLEVHKPQNGETAANADLQAMVDAQASILADGTIDGTPFTFKTSVDAEERFEGDLVLQDGSNLTLSVDASGWFASGGARLDPRNESNRSQIENNIQQSFRAFPDDDHDGHDDL